MGDLFTLQIPDQPGEACERCGGEQRTSPHDQLKWCLDCGLITELVSGKTAQVVINLPEPRRINGEKKSPK